ncbi:hypothetical protein ZWY2020_055096 [Hordeum vulgare]|nr:hypothetical protein ZWY2020_055096 [Hordeum vulgare]
MEGEKKGKEEESGRVSRPTAERDPETTSGRGLSSHSGCSYSHHHLPPSLPPSSDPISVLPSRRLRLPRPPSPRYSVGNG